jgi:hypothetical protein
MKKLTGIMFAVMVATAAYTQTSIPKAQSLFIYNFSRLIEWPANYRTGDFVIGILGTAEVAGELETYTKGKKVGVQNIQVIRYKTLEEIQQCHILFIPFVRTKQLPLIVTAMTNKSTLIITEKAGALTEGSAINFVVLNDRMKFELKPENANKYGIKFSAKLQEMATGGAMMF